MGIHQLSVNHDERQDRLLLRVNTQEGEEFRFWLTRRMVARLLPAIEHAIGTLESQRSGMTITHPQTRQLISEMQREAFVQQADFKTPYAPQTQNLPLGEQPLLVTDVQLTLLPQQLLQMVFQDHSHEPGRQCQLQLVPQLVHGLLHLSQQAVSKADWGLVLRSEGSSSEETDANASPVNPGYAH